MSDSGAAARLVVPEGLLVDETVRERMEHQLAVAPETVCGIAAEVAGLAPGASYRVHVEWAALESPWPTVPTSATLTSKPVRGAVLLRPGVEFEVRDGTVGAAPGSLLVDPGAYAHDPHRPPGPLQPASERGRPPFPRRPVVVFLGCEPARDADWVRRLVNRLVRHDVEARIATPDAPAAGPHLTRPCSPVEATIRALAPDVVVTLDESAAAVVDAWCAGDRSTVVVALDPALPEPMELVSWQIGRAAGRLRARIGPWVDVVAFAALVGRLCAGPHPAPPSDQPQLLELRRPVREHWSSDAPSGCVIVTGGVDAPSVARAAGLADNLGAAGIAVTQSSNVNDVSAAARDAAIVVLAGTAPAPDVDALIADRRRAGLPTVVDLGPADVETEWVESADSGPVAHLTAAATARAVACGLVVSPAGLLHELAAGTGERSLVLPTLLVRSRAAALRDARTSPEPGGVLVIGWRIGAGRGSSTEYSDAVAEGIAITLNDRRNRVEIVGDAAMVPQVLRGDDRVSFLSGDALDPDTLARWAGHLWTPALIGDQIIGDARLFEEAGCAGVPSVIPAAAAGGVDGFVSPFVLVHSVGAPGEWANSLHHVLDNADVRERRAREAQRRADALDSAATSKAVVSRLAGWASYHQPRARVRA